MSLIKGRNIRSFLLSCACLWLVQVGHSHPAEVRGMGLVAFGELSISRNELTFVRKSSRRTWGSVCAEFIADALSLPAAAGGVTLGAMGLGEIADGKDIVGAFVKMGSGLMLMGAAAARFYYLPDPHIEGVAFSDRTFHLQMLALSADAKQLVKAVRDATRSDVGSTIQLRVTDLVWGANQRSEGYVSFGDISASMLFHSTEP